MKQHDNIDDTAMGMGEVYRFITMYSSAMDVLQLLREFFHNSAHAIVQLGGGRGLSLLDRVYGKKSTLPHIAFDLHWYRFGRKKAAKLAIVDCGIGMNEDQLRSFIGRLASSGICDTERKGMGAKIAGLNLSPHGLMYITWNGTDDPVCGIMRLDHEQRRCGWVEVDGKNTFTHPKVSSLHPMIREAGHGTQVVLLGNDDADDTFTRFREEMGRTKALAYMANTRYLELPENLRIGMATPRAKSTPHATDMRTADVTGMNQAIEYSSDDWGTWHGDGYDVVWSHMADLNQSRSTKRRYSHGDNCLNHQVVAVAIGDVEVPGMWEVYDLHTSHKARALLAEFGLGPIANHVALQIRIHDRKRLGIGTNAERTQLLQNARPLELHDMAKLFREDLPVRLEEILTADIASRVVDHRVKMEQAIMEFSDMLRPLIPTPPTDGTIADPPPDTTGEPEPEPEPKPKPEPEPKPKAKPPIPRTKNLIIPGWMPEVTVWLADNRPEYEKDCLARYDSTHRLIEMNHDSPIIDSEVEWVMKERGLTSERDRFYVRDAVTYHLTIAVMETVLRTERLMQSATTPQQRDMWEETLNNPHALSLSMGSFRQRKWHIAQELKSTLGAKIH